MYPARCRFKPRAREFLGLGLIVERRRDPTIMALPTTDRPSTARRPGDRWSVLAPLVLLGLLAMTVHGDGAIGRPDRPAPQSAPAGGPVAFADGIFPDREMAAPAAPATPAPAPAPAKKWLPSGKGMWIYLPDKTESGNVAAIVAKAKATGLTHLWVRMGSAWDGFNVIPFVDRLLPAAHAAGIRVIGWDFPKLEPLEADVERALTMIGHTAPGGHRIDAFSADIETRAEGTRLSAEAVRSYGSKLRAGAGADYPLIATVPRPSKERSFFPYADVVADYDAIAPMVYWLDRQPDTDVAGALRDLARFGKPVYPVGQAYDGSPEGGRRGVPPPDELNRFMTTAHKHGAAGVSFWSWQHANQPAWDTIRDAAEFRPAPDAPAVTTPTALPSP